MKQVTPGNFIIRFYSQTLEGALKSENLKEYSTICEAIKVAMSFDGGDTPFEIYDSRGMVVYESVRAYNYEPEFEDWWVKEYTVKCPFNRTLAEGLKKFAKEFWIAAKAEFKK